MEASSSVVIPVVCFMDEWETLSRFTGRKHPSHIPAVSVKREALRISEGPVLTSLDVSMRKSGS